MQDTTYFASIIIEHKALIYKVSRVYVDNLEDQKDLYQEIVYQLWKSFGNFKGNSKISTWMYRVAMNTAIAYLNKSKKQERILTGFELPDCIEDTTTEIEEQTAFLYNAINQLSLIERGVVLLFLEGKSYQEIGEITGFSESNVGTRMSRIKVKLKKIIKT